MIKTTLKQTGLASLCAASLLALSAQAASVSYLLNESNSLSDGPTYATVTIDDLGTSDTIQFTVTPNASIFTSGANYGVQQFGFNVIGSIASGTTWSLPSNWSKDSSKLHNMSTFGKFEVEVKKANGGDRQDPLVFSLINSGLTLASFAESSLDNKGKPTGYYFAAHIAGFTAPVVSGPSTWVGGSTVAPVPVPAAAWLFGTGLAALGLVRRRNV